jgi:hypothetical protein
MLNNVLRSAGAGAARKGAVSVAGRNLVFRPRAYVLMIGAGAAMGVSLASNRSAECASAAEANEVCSRAAWGASGAEGAGGSGKKDGAEDEGDKAIKAVRSSSIALSMATY